MVVASMRSSFGSSVAGMDSWPHGALHWTDDLAPEAFLGELWSALGVEDDVAECLVTYRVRWLGEAM